MKTTKEDFERLIEDSTFTIDDIVAINKSGRQLAAAACYELAKQMQPKWIPVSEPPEKKRKVLLWIPLYQNKTTGHYEPEWEGARNGYVLDNDNIIGEPTHWQELPQPPTI